MSRKRERGDDLPVVQKQAKHGVRATPSRSILDLSNETSGADTLQNVTHREDTPP